MAERTSRIRNQQIKIQGSKLTKRLLGISGISYEGREEAEERSCIELYEPKVKEKSYQEVKGPDKKHPETERPKG